MKNDDYNEESARWGRIVRLNADERLRSIERLAGLESDHFEASATENRGMYGTRSYDSPRIFRSSEQSPRISDLERQIAVERKSLDKLICAGIVAENELARSLGDERRVQAIRDERAAEWRLRFER